MAIVDNWMAKRIQELEKKLSRRMSYIENCKKHPNTIIENFEEARLVKDCLDKDLIKELLMYSFTEAYNTPNGKTLETYKQYVTLMKFLKRSCNARYLKTL